MSVNTGEPFPISSPHFEGKVLAYIKGFPNGDGELLEHEYFEREDRAGVTWSIQFQGASSGVDGCGACILRYGQAGSCRRYLRTIYSLEIHSIDLYSYRGALVPL